MIGSCAGGATVFSLLGPGLVVAIAAFITAAFAAAFIVAGESPYSDSFSSSSLLLLLAADWMTTSKPPGRRSMRARLYNVVSGNLAAQLDMDADLSPSSMLVMGCHRHR